jgi:hypothetical protein
MLRLFFSERIHGLSVWAGFPLIEWNVVYVRPCAGGIDDRAI